MNFAKTPALRALARLSTPARRLPSAITTSSRAFSSVPMVFQQVQRPESTFDHVTFEALTKEDAAVSHLQNSAYARPASDDRIANAKAAMEAKGFVVHAVEDKNEAFHKILELIPEVNQKEEQGKKRLNCLCSAQTFLALVLTNMALSFFLFLHNLI